MQAIHSEPLSAAAKNLRRLFWLRTVMIGFLTLTLLLLVHLNIPLKIAPIAAAVGSLILLNAFTWWRLHSARHLDEFELLLQLLGDIAALTVLFYFSGGYSNPFVWMYLLPVAIAAVALRTLSVWLIAALAIACYSALVFWHVPLSHLHVHTVVGMHLDIHLVGMWLGFMVSAGIIAFFVTRIGQSLRDYERMMALARENALESERILALGTLATAAAHELGTPLATMAVLTRELSSEYAGNPQLQEDLALLRKEVDRCKNILTTLTSSAGQARVEQAGGIALDDFVGQTLARWRDTRPAVELEARLEGELPSPQIAADRTLGMALVNLLDNAADASPGKVDIDVRWNRQQLDITIRDYGPGLSEAVAASAGKPFFTTKEEKGMGIGLYLTRMILSRFDGTVTLENHPQGGTLTEVRLPITDLIVERS
jgi:two-component system sensor histidine kinase RegB